MTDTTAAPIRTVQTTTFAVLFAISFCHLLNDMMQAVLPAIYPTLKGVFQLSFAQVGLVTMAFQCTASLLQPWVGFLADKKPAPYSLAIGMVSTLIGMIVLGFAWQLLGAAGGGLPDWYRLVGVSSRNPRVSRAWRQAAALDWPRACFRWAATAAPRWVRSPPRVVIANWGQKGVALYAAAALLAIVVLVQVGSWYKHHGLAAHARRRQILQHSTLPRGKVVASVVDSAAADLLQIFLSDQHHQLLHILPDPYFHVSVQVAQVHLFAFLVAVALGTLAGGPLGDRFGRKYVIWFSILGMLPFTLLMPYANLFWTGVLSVIIGFVMASAFPAIVVYAQELLPGRSGMVSGLFFGFAFGMGGIGAAVLGALADATSITFVYKVCAFLPVIGLLTVFLPDFSRKRA